MCITEQVSTRYLWLTRFAEALRKVRLPPIALSAPGSEVLSSASPHISSARTGLPEGTNKMEAYGRKCYEHGISASRAEKAKLSWSDSFFRWALSKAVERLEEFWEQEVGSHKYLREATPNEREEAKAVFFGNFERGLRDGAD